MRMFVEDYGGGPGVARQEVLWRCLRGLGDGVLRLSPDIPGLVAGLAGMTLLDIHTGNRLCRCVAACCPQGWSPEDNGACLYGRALSLHYGNERMLVLASLFSLCGLPPGSLLFFDAGGQLAQVLVPATPSARPAFEALISRHLHPHQDWLPVLDDAAHASRAPADDEISGLERLWCRCTDEAEFGRALASRGLCRARVYARLKDNLACPVAPETLPSVLSAAQSRSLALGLTLMLPGGCRQWHRGVPHARDWHDGVLSFCLGASRHQWQAGRIGSVWRVRRPGLSGIWTSLEVLDDRGDPALILDCGEEEPWHRLLAAMLYRPCPASALPK